MLDEEIIGDLERLITNSIKKRIPKEKYAILFSGGIDSTTIALIIKKLTKEKPICIVSGIKINNQLPDDVIWAERVAKKLGFELYKNIINFHDFERYLKKVIEISNPKNSLTYESKHKIEKNKEYDKNKVKHISISIPLYLSLEKAKKLSCRMVFSGLGSDEIFAGYHSHKQAKDINNECLRRIKNIHNDLERDNKIAKFFNIQIITPFLDRALISYALKIDPKLKVKKIKGKIIGKYILRKTIERIIDRKKQKIK